MIVTVGALLWGVTCIAQKSGEKSKMGPLRDYFICMKLLLRASVDQKIESCRQARVAKL